MRAPLHVRRLGRASDWDPYDRPKAGRRHHILPIDTVCQLDAWAGGSLSGRRHRHGGRPRRPRCGRPRGRVRLAYSCCRVPGRAGPVLAKAGCTRGGRSRRTGHTFYLGSTPRRGATGGTGPHRHRTGARAANDRGRARTRPLRDATAISGIVFSGVAGSTRFIGDVAGPNRWSDDHGASWIAVDPAMFAGRRSSPAGRPARTGQPRSGRPVRVRPEQLRTVHLNQVPEVVVGGERASHDPFAGAPSRARRSPATSSVAASGRAGPGPAPDALGFLIAAVPFSTRVRGRVPGRPGAQRLGRHRRGQRDRRGRPGANALRVPFIGFRGVSTARRSADCSRAFRSSSRRAANICGPSQ